ncbi:MULTISPECIES: hypothetical protein [unclassified Bartonella]|uniref:hypothetical protein n=1 Tax=unclassified Bartonella TaxID=2645622 RepID=UPI002361AFCA|nr:MULTISPECIES: hypothetical protein [unclassified Bartonella]
MNFLVILFVVLTAGSMIVIYSVITVCSTMAIIAIYYSFIKRIKRARKLSQTFEEQIFEKLKKNATEHLSGDGSKIKEKRPAFNTKAYLSSFQESLMLSKKDYKRIFIFSLIVFVFIFLPFAFSLVIEGAKFAQGFAQGMDIKQIVNMSSGLFRFYIIMVALVFLATALVAFSLPVILIFYGIVNQKVKKNMKRLEKLA